MTNAAAAARPNNAQAMLWMLASTLVMTAMHAMIRHIGQDLHAFEIAFFRTVFGLVALMPLLLRYGLGPLKTSRPGLMGLRSLANTVAMLLFFYALTITPLATVTALSFTAPVFATVLAILVLGEVVRLRRWAAVFVGFLGMLVIVRPGIVEVAPGMLMVVLSSMIWAAALLIIKILSRTDSPLTITLYMGIMMTPLTLIPALFVWQWPTWEQLAWLAAIGAAGGFAQLGLAKALNLGDTSVVMPVDFFKLIWAAIIGYIVFLEIPDLFTVLGGVMIFAASTYIAIRESSLRKAPPVGSGSAPS